MKNSIKNIILGLVLCGSSTLYLSCQDSLYQSFEDPDPLTEAAVYLDRSNPDAAIKILRKSLANDPDNYPMISLLSSAIAQKYGIDTITIALKMVESQKEKSEQQDSATASTSSSNNNITVLFIALPEPTDAVVDGLDEAITTMESIPTGVRTSADNFKLTLFYTSRLGLLTKKFDKDGDGIISPAERLTMTIEDASAILENLLSAENIVAAAAAMGGASSGASVENISTIRSAIDGAAGSTTEEKLMNYLQSSSAGGSSVPTSLPTTLPTVP